MDNVSLMASFSLLFPGLIAEDTISPEQDEVSGTEGESVTLTCNYQTEDDYVYLYWYKHHSDLQAPQFILLKGFQKERFDAQVDNKKVPLKISSAAVTDSAVYYCAVRPTVTEQHCQRAEHKRTPTVTYIQCCHCITGSCFLCL
uniref:Ig-like domain-containing protein n=1 Tax=Amphiprion percula TaxID=161767 RepID=A0A3P8SP27_AMPPE